MRSFALTIFAGAFLLFAVQPLIGKYILPWFGGSPGVWTACMMFFQVLLLGGYAYAHFASRWLKPRTQAVVHLVLLALALAALPITPGDAWKPHGGGNPTADILLLLVVNLGLPYFVLSSSGPLMQQWFSRTHPGVSPYRLFSLSNAGSLLALISYPVFVESHFTRGTQAALWAGGLVAYVLCCLFCALNLWKAAAKQNRTAGEEPAGPETNKRKGRHRSSLERSRGVAAPERAGDPRPAVSDHLLWLALPACASMLLLATTNKLCLDMAVIPFLWVLPLALYLFSFVICFDHPRWYQRVPFTVLLFAGLAGVCWAIRMHDLSLWRLIAVYCGALFACCMVCHGELYRLRPDPRHLTGFYLMTATGGALGAILVAIAAPAVFLGYHELYVGAWLCGLLFLLACLHDRNRTAGGPWRGMSSVLPILLLVGLDWLLASRENDVMPLRLALWGGAAVLLGRAIWGLTRGKSAPGTAAVTPRAEGKNPGLPLRHHRLTCVWLSLGLLELGIALWFQQEKFGDQPVHASRNFYGVLRVFDHAEGEPPEYIRWVSHGQTIHGAQFLGSPKAAWPTLYYGEESGVGRAVRALAAPERHLGLVGLGAGTLATYARPSDSVHVYEINPEMQKLARLRFAYLSNCLGRVEFTLGDARLSLEQAPAQNFDLLALDAFGSDAVPVHLLTTEAFAVYDRHLKTNGVIAVHISNKWLDLEPVLVNVARHFAFKLVIVDHVPTGEQWWLRHSVWALLTRDREMLDSPVIRNAARPARDNAANVPLWTDDFSSLFQLLR